ncbi:hypothetical protein ARAF_1628 [Arsenophonus endosymbiont of Aleurodicus floccissimus]|uniref:FxsA family protein n=1 Tax=Arsenophonus endosymbiont of Aleurodicus floccissimus TaxID=2152761 RepID=UPI000EED359B|nr:hypothetical protein ARAF_1628 [Arsenophonus endosymbiont of Aleurodicus floccissimus]
MRWFPFILLCLLIYIEEVIFVRVAESIGVLTTLILVVLTSCLGTSLVKSQGIKNLLWLIRQKLADGKNLADEMIKNVALVIAGILLIIPGLFMDFLGLLLLFSPIQKLIVVKLICRIFIFILSEQLTIILTIFQKGIPMKVNLIENLILHQTALNMKTNFLKKKIMIINNTNDFIFLVERKNEKFFVYPLN